MSLNEQFNQGYEDMIETIKSRAIWRVGEQIEEGETFRCRCPTCGYDSLHQRFDIRRHRLLFGKAVREIEAPRPMVRCRRCSQQRHLRDVGELVVPSTIALFDAVQRAAVQHLATEPGPAGATTTEWAPPAELDELLAAFRDEASGPIRQQLLTAIARDCPDSTDARVNEIGRALYLARDQIASAVEPET